MSDFNNIATFRLADASKIDNLPANTNSELAGKAAASHTHDDIYYTETETNSLLNGKQSVSEKGQPSGYASLDGTGKVPASQLPATVVDGDMSKSTYDTNDNGIVDNSEKLGGQLPSYYLDVDNHTDGTTNKVYTTTEKNKLAGIEAGAEVNTINSVVAGTNISIDNTDPLNPVISSTGGGGATSLDDLTDITITTPTNGQALTYNGTNWVNSTPAGAGDMSKAVYDPQDIEGDTFDRANHTGTQEVSTITANGNALAWNSDESALDIPLNANVTLQTGQETLWLGRNNTGSIIQNGTVVYATGTIGASGRITIAPYIADGSIIGMYTLGITTEDIAVGADGFITHFGKVRGIDTSSFTEGTVLYASPTTAGALTSTEPSYPNIRIPLAFVVTSHASVGTLAIRVPTVDQNASQVGYDNTTSGLIANNTQDAIDELESEKANDNEVVKLTGNQTISGNKTFSNDVRVGFIQSYGNGIFGDLTDTTGNYLNIWHPTATNSQIDSYTNYVGFRDLLFNGGALKIKSDGVVEIPGLAIKTVNGNSLVGTGNIVITAGVSFNGINGQSFSFPGEIVPGKIAELTAFNSGTFNEMQISTLTRTTGTTTVTVKKNGTTIGTATITSSTTATNGRYYGTSTDLADSFVANDVITFELSDTGNPAGTGIIINFK